VLSGIDADGTVGVKQVKAQGGMVMAQEPQSAEYPDMPRNAMATGLADFVLPVDQMGAALVNYARTANLRPETPEPSPSEEQDMTAILMALLKAGAPDFREYKPGMIERRIRHRMGLMGSPNLAEFRKQVEASGQVRQLLSDDFLIGVTEFFREPKAWAELAEKVLPELLSRSDERPVRIWVPGCASGEEAYTLAMLLSELAPSAEARARIEIFATDIDRRGLEIARAGIYPASVAHTVSPERLHRFFVQTGDSFQVKKELRSLLVFTAHNLLLDPPFSRMDLVSCRNLLIYLKPVAQRALSSLFAFSLNEGGYLFLGRCENLIDELQLFEQASPKSRIFKRKAGLRPLAVSFNLADRGAGADAPDRAATKFRSSDVAQLVHRTLLAHFAPAAVLAGPAFQILYYHGDVEPYLHRAPGAPSDNLLEAVRDGLSFGLRSAWQQAVDKGHRASIDAQMLRDNQSIRVHMEVMPLRAAPMTEAACLVTFRTLPPAVEPAFAAGGDVSDIERALRQAREEAQDAIHQLQQTNEDLKIANEEGLSANEELQASNEELASSKEEMQSLNEELTTVNAQLEAKVSELEGVNDDLDNLLQNTRIACLFLDRELRIRRYTAPTVSLFSLIPSDVGRSIADLANPFAQDDLVENARTVLATLNSVGSEVRAREGKWYWRAMQPYVNRANHVEGVVVTFTDISELKHAEESVRRLATVMQDSNDAIVVFDLEGHILEWNAAAERMYGYSAAEAQALGALSVVPEARRHEHEAMLARASRDEAVASFEMQRLTKEGRTLDVWITVSVLHDERGRPHAIASTERDISERLRTEEQLRLRAMRLQEVDRRRNEFLAMLGHELRNPLAPVRNALQLLRHRRVSPDQVSWATELMDRQTGHLQRLVDDLLDVSRITSGKVRLNREVVDIRGAVQSALEQADSLLQAREHRVSVELPQEPLWVFGDAVRLQQVIGNLLTNAYKYTAPGGHVGIKAAREGDEVAVSVVDSGMGIASELLPHIFDMFVQGDQTLDRAQGGLGIGLTLVRQLVGMHNGHVEAHTRGPGEGSEFVVRLPAMPEPTTSQASVDTSAEPAARAPLAPSRILLVDDNVDFADSLKLLLTYEGHVVEVCNDGRSAVEVAKQMLPDVVLLDLGLPGMNGFDTAREMRALPGLRDALLIAVSGYAQEEDRRRSAREGFAAHLKKPVDLQEIFAIMQSR
jgi:two-component system, chemotaxis family, CheB/CheR fusion protein